MKILKSLIGKYVIVQSISGVFFGKLTEYDPKTEHAGLHNVRRISGWEGAFTLSGIAKDAKGCDKIFISTRVDRILLPKVGEIVPVENPRYLAGKRTYDGTDESAISETKIYFDFEFEEEEPKKKRFIFF
jgi:hypothetical protein